jgi:O-acetyl-ADP-ribose deacetylase (regulator of RNase III)
LIDFELPLLRLEIVEGDIAAQATDAIVNAANNHFWMGAGVAGAIKARGGQTIEDEAMAHGPRDPGDCVITSAGGLAARFVIHAAVMGQDLQTSSALIDRATRNALALADAHEITSMALPAFGTGVGGFPLRDCARIMIAAVRSHTPGTIRLVRFVLFGRQAYRTFVDVAGDVLGTPSTNAPDGR